MCLCVLDRGLTCARACSSPAAEPQSHTKPVKFPNTEQQVEGIPCGSVQPAAGALYVLSPSSSARINDIFSLNETVYVD
jgi:hypothetical protein